MENIKTINILAISGSLKSTSSNANIFRTLIKLAPENIAIKIWDGLETLPFFNPDINEEALSVSNFRKEIKQTDGVIFSTPEYAFGVPGVLKNALDWLVSSGELNEKPVVAISASPLYSGGDKALASLLLSLTALGTNLTGNSTLSIANIKNKTNSTGEITDLETIEQLQSLTASLFNKIISDK